MNYLLGNPIKVRNAGLIYPIKMKDYLEFCNYIWTVEKSKKSLNREDDQTPLLHMLIEEDLMQKDENRRGLFLLCLIELIKMVTKSDDVRFIYETLSFIIDGTNKVESDGEVLNEEVESEKFINADNFENFREVVCKQNVIHEKRYYIPQFQKILDAAIKRNRKRNKGGSFETILQIVSIKMGITYEVISNMTYFQVMSNYGRIMAEKDYDTSMQFRVAGAECEISHFTKELEIFKNPIDSILKVEKIN